MLTLIFGIWMNVAQIAWLKQEDERCYIQFAAVSRYFGVTFENKSCDEVAAAINAATKGQ
jgi:hypothetical protein